MFVKPAEGLTIIDPILRDTLPAEGRLVEESMYWHRRIRDKDVELLPDPVVPEVTEAAAAAVDDKAPAKLEEDSSIAAKPSPSTSKLKPTA